MSVLVCLNSLPGSAKHLFSSKRALQKEGYKNATKYVLQGNKNTRVYIAWEAEANFRPKRVVGESRVKKRGSNP